MEPENQEQEILMENEPFLFGGEVYTEGFGIDINDQNEISVDTNEIQEKLTAGDNITIENNVISATGGGDSDFTTLTDEDVNFTDPDSGDEVIALWKLDSGTYRLDANLSVSVISYLVYEDENTVYAEGYVNAEGQPIILINSTTGNTSISIYSTDTGSSSHYGVATSETALDEGTLVSKVNLASEFGGVIDGATENGYPGLVPGPFSYDVNKFLRSDGTWQSIVAPTIVQTTGTSQTDIMSQNAVTGLIYADTSDTTDKIRVGNPNQIGAFGVSIGGSATQLSSVQRATNIGGGSQVFASGSTALGNNAAIKSSAYVGSVALGSYSQPSLAGEVHIGTSQTQYGFNNTNYRLLSGVHDPVRSQDAATKNYVDDIVVNYAGLYNAGAPTTSTVAYYLGQFYYDTTNDDIYYCSNIDTTDPDNPVYTWSALPTGGGGPTVVQTTGTSTTDVMSQNATTSMVFADAGTDTKIKIGSGATVSDQSNNMAIGPSASANGLSAMAIGASASSRNGGVALGVSAKAGNTSSQTHALAVGYNAQALGAGAIALGRDSSSTSQGEMNIGTSNTGYGYNSSNYRLISGVYDGQSAHDVATVGQINATIDAINTALNTNIPHIGA